VTGMCAYDKCEVHDLGVCHPSHGIIILIGEVSRGQSGIGCTIAHPQERTFQQ